MSGRGSGCFLWFTGLTGLAGLWLVFQANPAGAMVLTLLFWSAVALPWMGIRALFQAGKRRGQKRPAAVKRQEAPKPPSKKQQAAELKRKLDEAKELAAFIQDEDTRNAAIAEAEADFRQRLSELMR